MKQRNAFFDWVGQFNRIILLIVGCGLSIWPQAAVAQSPPASNGVSTAVQDLQQQVSELRAAVAEIRSEAAQYRAETAELRRELRAMRGQPGSVEPAPSTGSYASAGATVGASSEVSPRPAVPSDPLPDRVSALESQMHLTILDSTGGRHEGILLAASTSRMRVVVSGARDTVDLKLAEGGWLCEDGEPVEIESIVAGEDLSAFCSLIRPRTLAAGGAPPVA